MSRRVWVVNDMKRTLPGVPTFWDSLCDWLSAHFIGGDFAHLADIVETAYAAAPPDDRPELVIRNASYFGPLNLPVPQIVLVQDIASMEVTYAPDIRQQPMAQASMEVFRAAQAEVIGRARHVIYNSAYTRQVLGSDPARSSTSVIPLPVDFGLFRPRPSPINYDVCWIGSAASAAHIKGWDILMEVMMRAPDLRFALILKDEKAPMLPSNARAWLRLNSYEVAKVASQARMGLCTSRAETQHLAGIEMGGLGLPMVAPNVGCYYERPAGVWGETVVLYPACFVLALRRQLERPPASMEIHRYWAKGFSMEACRAAWEAVVGAYRSGQTGLAVTQVAEAFGGSTPPAPTILTGDNDGA